jgi:threonine aldolase
MARLLEEKLRAAGLAKFAFLREANSLFVHLPDELAQRLHARGWQFLKFIEPDVRRLMCSWSTTESEVDEFVADFRQAQG